MNSDELLKQENPIGWVFKQFPELNAKLIADLAKKASESIEKNIDIEIKGLCRRVLEAGFELIVTPSAKRFVADVGYDPKFGARPLKRFLQKHVETMAAKLILSGEVSMGDTIELDAKDGDLVASVRKTTALAE